MKIIKRDFSKDELMVFDSSRGLMALFVAIAHISHVIWNPIFGVGVLSDVMGVVANTAVIVFFFLSGALVTKSAISLTSSNQFNYKQFFVNKFTRIYPTLIVSLFIVYVLMLLFPLLNEGTYDIKKLPTDLFNIRETFFCATFTNMANSYFISYRYYQYKWSHVEFVY